MAVHGAAAPLTPWSKNQVQPTIDESAYVHSFSNIIGDVTIGANVLIAPGTSIRADAGSPFAIGADTHVQDGVVIHGLEQGRVVGDDDHPYSVWIGQNTSITHMALIHGPAYIGDDCFIGFRSTVFNARVGHGCIVMMHVLIQDVTIPPGKFVPSGSIITTQQQADCLPPVEEADRQFVSQMVGIHDALRSGYHSAENVARITPIRQRLEQAYGDQSSHSTSSSSSSQGSSPMNTRLDSKVVELVRHLLAQGLIIGTEHADKRRFQTSTWQSCTPIQLTREADVLAALEACAAEHANSYVRLFGIDTKSRRRISETIIQRPGDSALDKQPASHASSYSSSHSSSSYSSYSAPSTSSSNRLSPEVVQQIRNFISQGYRLGTEHADVRRFRINAWHSCAPIQATREGDAIAALESCLAEHEGEYVRLFGIDTKSKSRISEIIVQRPGGVATPTTGNGRPAASSSYSAPASHNGSSNGYGAGAASGHLSPDVVSQVRQMLSQGYRVSAEHADKRRFQTSTWHTCAPIQGGRETDVIAALESCLVENSGEYVRVVGVDAKTKRRIAEMIIQRP